jgi:hypothetical protein
MNGDASGNLVKTNIEGQVSALADDLNLTLCKMGAVQESCWSERAKYGGHRRMLLWESALQSSAGTDSSSQLSLCKL